MGIKNFLCNLDHDNSATSTELNEFEHLYIDGNYILHILMYNTTSEEDLYNKTFYYIRKLLKNVNITKSITVLFDGIIDDNSKTETCNLRSNKNKNLDMTLFENQSIKPGSKILKLFIKYLSQVFDKLQVSVDINFVNDDIPGECDFKILNHIKQHRNRGETICLFSKDSDMVLISYSLTLSIHVKIYILINYKNFEFISINKLQSKFQQSYLSQKINDNNYDYVLLIFLLGNDYLPKISKIDYNVLINTYSLYINVFNDQKIIQNKQLIYKNFINFISLLVANKNIKFNINNINYDRFTNYYNNLLWCLKKYNVIENNNQYIGNINVEHVLDIYNFINVNVN